MVAICPFIVCRFQGTHSHRRNEGFIKGPLALVKCIRHTNLLFTWIINNSIWFFHSVCRFHFFEWFELITYTQAERQMNIRRWRAWDDLIFMIENYNTMMRDCSFALSFIRYDTHANTHTQIFSWLSMLGVFFFSSFCQSDNINWILSYVETFCCLEQTIEQ